MKLGLLTSVLILLGFNVLNSQEDTLKHNLYIQVGGAITINNSPEYDDRNIYSNLDIGWQSTFGYDYKFSSKYKLNFELSTITHGIDSADVWNAVVGPIDSELNYISGKEFFSSSMLNTMITLSLKREFVINKLTIEPKIGIGLVETSMGFNDQVEVKEKGTNYSKSIEVFDVPSPSWAMAYKGGININYRVKEIKGNYFGFLIDSQIYYNVLNSVIRVEEEDILGETFSADHSFNTKTLGWMVSVGAFYNF